MVRKSVGLEKDLADAPLHGMTIGGKHILVAKVNNHYFAMGNICTHDGCWLSGGKLEGATVRCPCHGSVFNVKTGEAVHGPAERPGPVFSVMVENGELFIEI